MRNLITQLAMYLYNRPNTGEELEKFVVNTWLGFSCIMWLLFDITFFGSFILYMIGGVILLGSIKVLSLWGNVLIERKRRFRRTIDKILSIK